MAASPENKPFAAAPGLEGYVRERFLPEDPVLERVRSRAEEAGLPAIHVSPFDGRLLEVIARAALPRMIVEIGTLAGYSGICLARALLPGGMLHTLEIDPRHAAVAQQSFQDAGVADSVRIYLGPARETLAQFGDTRVDVVFIDADKEGYPDYVRWAGRALRPGGIVFLDNAFGYGLIPDGPFASPAEEKQVKSLDVANRLLAEPDGLFRAMMIPTSEGLAMGVRI